MKIVLIILLNITPFIFSSYRIKNIILVLIPGILTFLEPDTGNVIFYFFVLFMVFILNEQPKNIMKVISGILIVIISFILIYKFDKRIFISLFGQYRIKRIESLLTKESYQLNMSLISIGSSSLFGNNSLINVPFFHTDFAFSMLTSLTGFVGSIIYLIINLLLNIQLLRLSKKQSTLAKNITLTFLCMKIIQESINILMTVGIVPITGITLPFISYGGSSLLIYAIMLGLINNKNCYNH